MNDLTRTRQRHFKNLERLSTYLCGPIKDCDDTQVHTWRNEITHRLRPYPITIYDPSVRDYREKLLHTPFDELEYLDEAIVTRDEEEIEHCELLICNCHMTSVGSSMEIYNAWHADKYVLTIVYSIRGSSPWLRYHSTHMIETMHLHDMEYLSKVLEHLQLVFPKVFAAKDQQILT